MDVVMEILNRIAAKAGNEPPPKIPDEVLGAMKRPEVMDARNAFLDYADDATEGELFPTNYYDQVLYGAFKSMRKSGRYSQEKADELMRLYGAFVDSLLPFQPSEEVMQAFKTQPRMPWQAPPPGRGDVFYHIESSGGYWINGRDAAAAVVAKIDKP